MSSNSPVRAAAFFDLDRTLVRFNSAYLYARYERRMGRLSRLQLLRAGLWMGLYHLSLVDMARAYEQALQHYRGERSEHLAARTREWFEAEVGHHLLPGARAALDHHRGSGHPLVLLTASSCWLAEVSSRAWGLEHWIANVFPMDDDGCLTGAVSEPLCYGPGKTVLAERWAEQHGVDVGRSWFYSDSYSDVPMLERVAHPRVVNPDPRLRRHARRRGWPILDWSAATAAVVEAIDEAAVAAR